MHAHRAVHMHGKAELRTKIRQLFNTCFGTMAEAKVAALVQRADLQSLYQHPLHKVASAHLCQRGVKGQHNHGVNTGCGEQPYPLMDRCDQLGRERRAEELLRVRLERDDHRPRTDSMCLCNDRRQNFLMTTVDSVKV